MIDGYDIGIRYMDDHIGRIFEELKNQGLMEDLIIVITADHGENLGELGIYGEHGTADHGTCRIPMIIRWPGITSGHVDHGLHYSLDLAPTLAEMLQNLPKQVGTAPAMLRFLKNGKRITENFLSYHNVPMFASAGFVLRTGSIYVRIMTGIIFLIKKCYLT